MWPARDQSGLVLSMSSIGTRLWPSCMSSLIKLSHMSCPLHLLVSVILFMDGLFWHLMAVTDKLCGRMETQ